MTRPMAELLARRPEFDPRAHAPELLPLLEELLARDPRRASDIDAIVRRYPRGGKALFARSELIAGLRAFGPERGWGERAGVLVERLRRRRVRTRSGVAPVTVLTQPFPCPGQCVFCPRDVRMPRSYLAREPGAQRATQARFDPYVQTRERLRALEAIGHPVDKVELIVLGGTWTHYPEPYRIWFIKRCFDALNDHGAAADDAPRARLDFLDLDADLESDLQSGLQSGVESGLESGVEEAAPGRSYNAVVSEHLRDRLDGALLAPEQRAGWAVLEAAHAANEQAAARCVGLSLETRPDEIDAASVAALRRLGATKVQLGVQSLSDAVLDASRRGHDVAATRRALRLLRAAGFKLHVHWMPNLPESTPDADRADFARMFADPDFRPDELKLYPCVLVPSAELVDDWRAGRWAPYDEDALTDLVVDCMAATPRWCRLTRVVRDISAQDIVAGSRTANLREVAERRLGQRGQCACDVRAREIRGDAFDAAALRLVETRYATSAGEECFLEIVTPDDRLLAFCRLTLPAADAAPPLDELCGRALLRELHAYGDLAPLGRRPRGAAQHLGLGRRLVERAAGIARASGYGALAVISAVGTRAYYARLGFERGALYQHRELRP